MKNILFSLMIAVLAVFYSCDGMYDNIDKYSGESVYPAKFDTIIGHIGFERVELDLMKAGRIPASKVNMGKATRTIVEAGGRIIAEYDSLCSWVNITGLDTSKLYRFKVYTVDEHKNPSVAQEIALIPFTANDRNLLGITAPRIMASPSSAFVDWPNGLSSVMLDFKSFTYEYVDKDNNTVTGSKTGSDTRIVVSNTEIGAQVELKLNYTVIPKSSGKPILDEVTLSRTVTFNMPTGSTPFIPVERDILTANGVTAFTIDGASSFTKLTYPVHTGSLQDIFYFPYLKELDLTGGTMFLTTELVYDRNGVRNTVGNKPWTHFLSNVHTIDPGDCQALKDLLEAGLLDKITYAPNSIPGLDAILAPYVGTVVELVTMPQDSYITFDFLVDGRVQDGNWQMDLTVPATDAPAGAGLVNVFKATPVRPSASFIIAIPKEYKFNVKEYPYLKFKIYMPPAADVTNDFHFLWPRFMNCMWSFGGNTVYGQEYWAPANIGMTEFQRWVDVTVPLATSLNNNLHTRVVVMNIGGEKGKTPDPGLNYYFANIRLSKTN